MDKNKDLKIYSDLDRRLRFQDSSPEEIKLVHSRILKFSKTRVDVSYTIIGKLLHGSGEFQKSLLPLKKATIINPENAIAQICLANSFLNLRKEDKCFFTIKKALSVSPRESPLHSLILKILKDRNQFQDLSVFYQETASMMKNKRNIIDLYFRSAEILENIKMVPQALEQYKKANETNAMRFDHYVQYGNVLVRHGLCEEAIVQFEHVLKLNPMNELAMNNIASLHYELGRIEKAFEVLEEIIKNCLQTNMTYLNLLLVLECLNKDEEVIKKYKDRAQHYIQRNREEMQLQYKVELMRTEGKLESGIDEKAREFYVKKLKALNVI
mgnify:CR=1 FL=1